MGSVTHLRTGIQYCMNDSRAYAHRCSRLRCTMLTLTLSLCDVHSSLTLSGCAKQTAEASVLQFGAEICF